MRAASVQSLHFPRANLCTNADSDSGALPYPPAGARVASRQKSDQGRKTAATDRPNLGQATPASDRLAAAPLFALAHRRLARAGHNGRSRGRERRIDGGGCRSRGRTGRSRIGGGSGNRRLIRSIHDCFLVGNYHHRPRGGRLGNVHCIKRAENLAAEPNKWLEGVWVVRKSRRRPPVAWTSRCSAQIMHRTPRLGACIEGDLHQRRQCSCSRADSAGTCLSRSVQQTVALQLVLQRTPADPQHLGRLGAIRRHFRERLPDE